MKKCPFCKNEIVSTSVQCPICKMTLIEKVLSVRSIPDPTYTSSSPKSPKAERYSYTPPRKEPKLSRRGQGWLVSIIGSLLLTGIINHNYTKSNPLPPPISVSEEVPIIDTNRFTSILLNGKVIFSDPSFLNGSGTLTISNGSDSDAVVKLITNNGRRVYSVYVSKNNSYPMENIKDGVYRVLFSFGTGWDPNQKKFLVNSRAEAFNDTFDFQTTNDGEYIESDIVNVTLNPVVNGNARTNPVDLDEFDKY